MRRKLTQIFVLVLAVLGSVNVQAALSGGYTIGAGPATSTNYSTFAAAISDLNLGTRPDGGPVNGPGVSAAVVFTVAAGTYNEQVLIPAIAGASAINTITFDGVDPLACIVTRNSTVSGDYTIRLNGADYIRLNNLGIQNTGVSFGFALQLLLSADNNIVSGCRILQPTTATATGKVGIMAGTTYTTLGLFASNFRVENSTFIGGYIGLGVNGPSGVQANGLEVHNNTFTNVYFSAMYLQYINLANVRGNTITMRNGYTSSYGAQLRYCSQFDFSSNRINNVGLYGLYVLSANFNGNNVARISNNMIGGVFQTTGTAYGLYITTCRFLEVLHNSVYIDNPTGTGARCLYQLGTSVNIDIRNNAFATTNTSATAYAIYITTASVLSFCQNNAYYTDGPNLAYFQANHASLATMQTAFPAYNQNCQDVWPNYLSNTDLHTFGPALSNWATNIPTVLNDIDNNARPLPPDLIQDVGADEFNLPLIDADVWSLVSPIVPIIGSNVVQAQIQNNGTNSLNGTPITLQYSTDGGTTWPVTQTFTPTTLGSPGAQETFTFTTPWVISVAGNYNLCVRISPVLVGDPDTSDQLCASLCTGMSGNYTVNSALPTSGINFNSMTDLATALSGCGISGPVNVDVAPGLYVETFTIGTINGSSSVNTVTIDGGDTSLVTIAFNHTTLNSSVITLNGADYVTFKNLKVNSAGASYGSCFKFTNAADYNTVDSCVMTLPIVSTSAYHIGILASGNTYTTYSNSANYLTVSNSFIRGGYYGVRINGVSTSVYTNGNRVLNTSIKEYYYYGIYSFYQNAPEFIDNQIIPRSSGVFTTSSYGIYSNYAQGNFRFEGNTIHSVGLYGIYANYGNHLNTGKGRIINNMIGGNFQNATNAYGLYMLNSRDVDILHNSIHLSGSAGYAVYISGGAPTTDSLRLINNIFSGGGAFPGVGGRALYVVNPTSIQSLNYNLYYSQGPQVVYWGGTTFNSLNAFQTSVPAFNANSLWDDPGFVSSTNLHLICSPIDNLGTPVMVANDIDEQTRSLTTPDIGADEFTSISVSTSLGPDFAVCGGTTIYADTIAFNNFLWGGGQFHEFLNIDTTGQYTIFAIDSNNCRARDTIFVTVDSLPLLPYNGDTLTACDNTILDAQNQGSTYLWSNGPTTQTNNPGIGGTYTVTITTTAGCALTDMVTIDLLSNPLVELGNDTTFCLGAGAFLDAGSGPTGTTYQWSTGASSQILVISSPGLYHVTVSSPFGCTAEDSVYLNILLSPVVNLGANRTECGPFTLDAQNPGNSYAWSTGANSQTINATTSGNYAVTVTNANGCSSTDVVSITVATPPSVALGPNPVLCSGQTVTLNAGNPGSSYLWSSGATTQSITVSNAGTYIVNVTNNSTGCVGRDTVEVTQSFLSVNLGPDLTFCPGDVVTLDAGAMPTSYQWSTGGTTQTIQVSSAGTYTVTVSDNVGCVLTDAITLNQGTAPVAAFNVPTSSLPLFQPLQFTDASAAATSWVWDFGDGGTSNLQNPTYTYLALGTYNACLTASNGTCSNTVCQTITVGPPVEIEDAIFANAINFYPNPNNGAFSLDFDMTKSVDLGIDVLTIAGQRMYHRELKAVRYNHESFDLQELSAGMYFLRVVSTKGDIWIKKLVIE